MKVLLTHNETVQQIWLEPAVVIQRHGLIELWHHRNFYFPPEYINDKPFRVIPAKDFSVTVIEGRRG